jgi:hypothetical protein
MMTRLDAAIQGDWDAFLSTYEVPPERERPEPECLCREDATTRYEHPECPRHVLLSARLRTRRAAGISGVNR